MTELERLRMEYEAAKWMAKRATETTNATRFTLFAAQSASQHAEAAEERAVAIAQEKHEAYLAAKKAQS